MSEHVTSPQQFEEHIIPGGYRHTVYANNARGYAEVRKDARISVPPVPEGHTRLWRSTNVGPHGHWADKPTMGYGSDLLRMDVPNADIPNISKGEHGSAFFFDRSQPMPYPHHKVGLHRVDD